MSIKAICPHCDESQKVPDDQAGTRVRCKGCGKSFLVEEEEVNVVEAVDDDRPSRKASKVKLDDVEEVPEEEEEPKKKGGGVGKILMIVGGVLFFLFVLCGGGVAGGIYYVYYKGKEAL